MSSLTNNVEINKAKSYRLSKSSVASVHLMWERSGSVVSRMLDSRLRGRWFEPHCVVSLSKNINPSLVLVQPRKTCPFITERLLMGRKESNQTNNIPTAILMCRSRGRMGGSPPPPGKSQVIRVSIEISIWTPLENVETHLDLWKKDSFLCYKTIGPP